MRTQSYALNSIASWMVALLVSFSLLGSTAANSKQDALGDNAVVVRAATIVVRVEDLRRFYRDAFGMDTLIESVEWNFAGAFASLLGTGDDAMLRTVRLSLFRAGSWEKGSCELYVSRRRNQIRSLSCTFPEPGLPAFEAPLLRFSTSVE